MADSLIKKMFGKAEETVKKLTRDPGVQKWLDEIESARKREEKFRKDAKRCLNIYEMGTSAAADSTKPSYNILYANTETISPAVYNNTPRPVVQRRFKDGNPITGLAAKVMQRGLEYQVKCAEPGYSRFDDLMTSAVTSALVPGRGVTRFRYSPTLTTVPPVGDQGQEGYQEGFDRVDYEAVCGTEWPWDRVFLGFAPQWADVPWLCFEHFMTREEAIDNFGEEVGSSITATASPEDGDKDSRIPNDSKGAIFCHVFEIWDRRSKQVTFISPGFAKPVKTVDDPAKLENFYPVPKPLCFLQKISSSVPMCLYLMYEEQAVELNKVSNRIIQITEMLKIRGFYDATLTGIDTLLTQPNGTLMPASNVAAMMGGAGTGGLDRAIWLMPIADLAQLLQQLYLNRQNIIQVIYQITGIADIMRGSSQASETLGAQKIKEAWGTMRLKRMQKEVQRYTCDSLRMMAELMGNNFSQQTWEQMTGFKLIPTKADKQQLQQAFQQAMAAAQQQAAMAQQQQGQPSVPGQQPQQSQQPSPQQQQPQQAAQPPQMPQAPPELSMPTWEEVLAVLKSDMLRNFSIDIETNSTIDSEATEDKEQVSEFMNAFSQLANGLGPLVQEGYMPWDAAKQLMLATVQRFRFGTEVEDSLREMKAPNIRPDPKLMAIQAKADAETKRDEERFMIDKEKLALEGKAKQQEFMLAKETTDMKMRTMQAQEASTMRLTVLKEKVETARLNRALAELAANAAVPIKPLGTD